MTPAEHIQAIEDAVIEYGEACMANAKHATTASHARCMHAKDAVDIAVLAGVGAAPEGWKLVPVEPTVAQREAMRKGTGMSFSGSKIAYSAMLAAAPKP